MMFIFLQKHQKQDFIEQIVITYTKDDRVARSITYLCCILETCIKLPLWLKGTVTTLLGPQLQSSLDACRVIILFYSSTTTNNASFP